MAAAICQGFVHRQPNTLFVVLSMVLLVIPVTLSAEPVLLLNVVPAPLVLPRVFAANPDRLKI